MKTHVTIPPDTIAPLGYLTPQADFGDVERGSPLPYTLPPDQRREVGLERETWRLEVVADPRSNASLENPLSIAGGTALDFAGLLRLAERHGVQYLKGMTCNNIGEPLGMGLWEGVPLREVIWLARPVENIRRVAYFGYHNDDPKQLFRSTLPFSRVLEDPPGELPVLLCYKLNGEFISGQRGGPVRLVVPEAYGFKSVKWLQRVELTNAYGADDTYQIWNNDLDSPMKTFARFVAVPPTTKAGAPIAVIGLAQVGVSGLAKVQWWLHPADAPLPLDDPHFTSAPGRTPRLSRRPTTGAATCPMASSPACRSSSTRRPMRRASGRCATPSPTGPPLCLALLLAATTCAAGVSTRMASANRCPDPSRSPGERKSRRFRLLSKRDRATLTAPRDAGTCLARTAWDESVCVVALVRVTQALGAGKSRSASSRAVFRSSQVTSGG